MAYITKTQRLNTMHDNEMILRNHKRKVKRNHIILLFCLPILGNMIYELFRTKSAEKIILKYKYKV